jgi:hypothetical protein
VTTWHPGGGDHEVLAQEPPAPRSTSARFWGTAAVCIALGALAGAQVDDALDARQLESGPPLLSAGVIQENPDPAGDLRFAVPLYNRGTREVTVDSVAALGWVTQGSRSRTVTIPPERWAMVPLRAQVDCAAIGPKAPDRLTVRSSTPQGSFEQEVPMPATSRVLDDEGSRLCVDPLGSAPAAQDLVGSWIVEEAGRFRGTMVRLREDGTFAIDPDLYRFGTVINALGTFTRNGAELRLSSEGGQDCRSGDRTVWGMTLLLDGRLHIRHGPSEGRWCGIEDGEVWVARRVPVGTAALSAP